MRGLVVSLIAGSVLVVLVLSSTVGALATAGVPASSSRLGSEGVPAGTGGPASELPVPTAASTPAPSASASQTFDQRVLASAHALAEAGVNPHQIRLPYTGRPAEVVHGAVVPGYALPGTGGTGGTSGAPVPTGLAYYGVSNTSGTNVSTVLNASSVAGTLTVNQLDALYLDVDTPDMWGIQENAVLGNVTVQGTAGFEFWVQNAVDVFQHNQTINLGDDTWNFSSPSATLVNGTTTILDHSPNGTIVGGLYVGEGPWLYAPLPFTLTLFVNSSLTAAHDQELWYNYSLSAAGGIHDVGNYDWIVFNSYGTAATPIAPFVANGTGPDPVGLPNDFEFDFGIGGYNGATMDVLSANVSATLEYCPVAIASCAPGRLESVPAAEDFGGETGETSSGLYLSYNGTTATGTAGPMILRGLWGFQGGNGSAPGSEPVTNAIAVSGAPEPSASPPYVFVFLSSANSFNATYEWAPDVPVWHLAPGAYQYEVVLSEYGAQTGSFVVGDSATRLAVTLPYHPSSGVYTPLWALDNGELAGISSAGNGTLANQYLLFNEPTARCTECAGAPNADLSPLFFAYNDYEYPAFPGILLDGTSTYVNVEQEVSFCAGAEEWGLLTSAGALDSACFDLQIEFVSTEHVTLGHDALVGGWPAFYETETLAGFVNASENPFPVGSVMVWNSSHDLVMANDFVPPNPIPDPGGACIGLCPTITCVSYACVSPDSLLLYGGSDNTVWGNTFRDPAAPEVPFAGVAEAESGDLVYNNNFSIDNPTVYLPFDIYTDACPDGYAGQCGPLVPPAYSDAWNVTPQPSTSVSDVANGFPLEGNVLGATCETQGGNYWNDYGDALNPTGSLPFVNRYNYSEIVSVLPPGSADVHSSITVGGDDAPLSRTACSSGESLQFREAGLPAGAVWAVELTGGFEASSSSKVLAVTVPSGVVSFTVLPPGGYGLARVTGPGSPTYDSVNVTGPTVLTVQFGALETISFDESLSARWLPGVPANLSWGVTLTAARTGGPAGASATTQGAYLSFSLPNGAAYRFVVSKPATFQVVGGPGQFTVPSHSLTKKIELRQVTATVAFVEHGLPSHTNWSVTITPVSPPGTAFTLYGTTSSLRIALTNGSYDYTIGSVGSFAASPSSGSFSLSAPHGPTVRVAFGAGAAPGGAPDLGTIPGEGSTGALGPRPFSGAAVLRAGRA